MLFMKSVFIGVTLTALFLVSTAGAQEKSRKPAPPARPGAGLQAALERELGLTPEQKKKWGEINAKYRPQIKAIDDKYRPKMQELSKQMQELRQKARNEAKPMLDARRKDLDAVLTPDQLKKKKELDDKLRAAMEQRRNSADPTAPKR